MTSKCANCGHHKPIHNVVGKKGCQGHSCPCEKFQPVEDECHTVKDRDCSICGRKAEKKGSVEDESIIIDIDKDVLEDKEPRIQRYSQST